MLSKKFYSKIFNILLLIFIGCTSTVLASNSTNTVNNPTATPIPHKLSLNKTHDINSVANQASTSPEHNTEKTEWLPSKITPDFIKENFSVIQKITSAILAILIALAIFYYRDNSENDLLKRIYTKKIFNIKALLFSVFLIFFPMLLPPNLAYLAISLIGVLILICILVSIDGFSNDKKYKTKKIEEYLFKLGGNGIEETDDSIIRCILDKKNLLLYDKFEIDSTETYFKVMKHELKKAIKTLESAKPYPMINKLGNIALNNDSFLFNAETMNPFLFNTLCPHTFSLTFDMYQSNYTPRESFYGFFIVA